MHSAATYGFIDGEQAFSAALLLVMVNMAFPYKELDASAMDTSLQVLQGMAERGNRYLRACHTLLTKIRETIKSQAIMAGTETNLAHQQPEQAPYAMAQDNDPLALMGTMDMAADQAVPNYAIDVGDDLGLWTEVLDSIGIDMDRHWIEAAFMAEENPMVQNT